MNPRVRLVVVGMFACAFAALAAVWIAALTDGEDYSAATTPYAGYVRPPVPVPELTLTDQHGRRVTPRRDELAIYTFVYSTCEDTCPSQVAQIRYALDQLDRDVPVYGISVDPANDTPQRARRFVNEQYMTGRMRFLLGTEAELAPVWEAFATAPQRDGREHSAGVLVADAQGRQRLYYPGQEIVGDGLARDLEKLVAERE